MKVISIINLKGGVGKTVTAVNLASILATEFSRRVLVIDADPQANATRFFGAGNVPNTLCDLFSGESSDAYDFIWETQVRGVEIVPATMELLQYDVAAALNAGGIVKALGDFIAAMRDDFAYDFVIIDCPPGFTAVSISGIAASDDIIIPTTVDAFAISGVKELNEQIEGVRCISPHIAVAGVLVTMWHNAPAVTQGEQYLRATGLPVFETTIRRTDKMSESTFARQPIREYSRYCSAARDYRDFAEEYLGRCE